jgi:hypothetical protein
MKGLNREEEAGVPSPPDANTSSSSVDTDSDDELKRLRHGSGNLVYDDDQEMELLSLGASTGNIQPTPSKKQKTGAVGGDLSPVELVKQEINNSLDTILTNRKKLMKARLPIWELISKEFPEELKEVALLLVGMPPTQVSVERLFSSLRILKTDHRNRLGEDILNSMMFLRSNL